MNIDYIKFLASYAEGFETDTIDGITFLTIPNGNRNPIKWFVANGDNWQKIYYPLLLQRAIEGWNIKNGIPSTTGFVQYQDDIVYYQSNNRMKTWKIDQMTDEYDLMTFDQAKEEALKCIWEQEKK